MGENLLKSVLSGFINHSEFIKWIRNDTITVKTNEQISGFDCSQSEFILYFLNYIHEETSGVLESISSQATPIKIKTPRRIEAVSERSLTTKRTSLFPELHTSINDLFLGVSQIETDPLTSTPHRSRSSFEKSTDHSCLSPISPAISRNHKNQSDTRNKSQSTPKNSRFDSSFCLGDFIVKRKSSSKKKQRQPDSKESALDPNIENCLNLSNVASPPEVNRVLIFDGVPKVSCRRINPTNLSLESSAKRITCLNDTNNGFLFLAEQPLQNTKDQRDALREERLKIVQRSKIDCNLLIDTRPVRTQSLSAVAPDVALVTHKPQLEMLALIYATLIDLNVVLNVLSELYFLIRLLLTQGAIENDKQIEELRTTLKNSLTHEDSGQEYFRTIHNSVFFASSVLNQLRKFLSALDRSSLKLLKDNARLRQFTPDLVAQLTVYHERKRERKTEIDTLTGGENVSFISDTDNRDNFLSDSSFHAFRKQRDLFYELLQLWEVQHMQPDWQFGAAFYSRIRSLLGLHSDPVNFMHLARLFKNQLIADCTQMVGAPPPTGLAPVDAGKLFRLHDRLVSRQSTGGPSPEPSFPARQEFYKDFILTAQSVKFHQHLTDCLVAETLQLNETVFCSTDVDDTVAVIDSVMRTLYINCLKSLKLLAKFLGFLDALPYTTESTTNSKVLSNQIDIRKHFTPSINLVKILDEAIRSGKLTLSIPWIAEYVAQLDHSTLRLPYFNPFIESLYELHYNTDSTSISTEPALMLKLCLGWLFERPTFPLDSYQSWISSKYQPKSMIAKAIKTIDHLRLDQLDLVDESVLYICCPYLIEIRNCLSSDPNANTAPVKYIRPVSTVANGGNIAKKRLELQLEEAFFHGHPTSMRRTVDLVAERVASACVKSICNHLVPDAKFRALTAFRKHLEHITTDCVDQMFVELESCCTMVAKTLASQVYEEFQKETRKLIEKSCSERCEISLKALLSDDIHARTKETCISITVHQTKLIVVQWFETHVNPGVFNKEFSLEIEKMKHNKAHSGKKLVYYLPARGRNVVHNPEAKSPVTLIAKLREFLFMVLQNPGDLKLEDIRTVIAEASLTCIHRCDLSAIAQDMICKMFLDLFLLTATHRATIACDLNLHADLVAFWEHFLEPQQRPATFERLLCPRNVAMFEQSAEPVQSWSAFSGLIVALLRSKLMSADVFKQQAITMFRYDWQPESVKHFSACLQAVLDQYSNGNDQFTLILNWLAAFCNDDEFF